MLHLGSVGRTSIDVDFNFFFLVLLFVYFNYDPQRGIQYALLWIPIVFVSVLVHELAHAGAIAMLGFGASEIVLTGMGGVTMNRRRAAPWQDLIISLAGPAASFGLYFLCGWLARYVALVHTDKMLSALIPYLAWANRAWGLFNLIPVPPLDGGHATRELFGTFLTARNAFIVSIWIAMVGGAGIAVYFAVWERSFLLALYIGWFVYMAFGQWQYFKRHGVPGD
ncbi:MAG TPA: M50 family metallopeptidase [Thermoanaerobaculia bacterium]|nr:M50 family metallopeptidase [Thermoanaerobaculia bacterium]